MHTDKGRNITMPPNTHTISALGPVAAAVAVHCRLQPAVTMNRATSRTPSARVRCGASDAELIVPLRRVCYWDAVARQSRMTAPTAPPGYYRARRADFKGPRANGRAYDYRSFGSSSGANVCVLGSAAWPRYGRSNAASMV